MEPLTGQVWRRRPWKLPPPPPCSRGSWLCSGGSALAWGAAGSRVCGAGRGSAGVGRGGGGRPLGLGWSDPPELFSLRCGVLPGSSDCLSEFLQNCKCSTPFLGASKAPLNPFQATGFLWGTRLRSCVKQKNKQTKNKADSRWGSGYAFGVSVSHSWLPP